ncbi:MAG: IPT/TIG domain-containing protein [Bacteroidota bacterium]
MQNKLILFLVTTSLAFSCVRELITPDLPVLFTGEVLDIDTSGALFTGGFRNIDPSGLTEYGFLLSHYPNAEKVNSFRIRLPMPFEKELCSFRDKSSLDADTVYFLRTYACYGEEFIYGNIVSFYSQGSLTPVIKSVSPEAILFGDTVRVYGENFGYDRSRINLTFNEDSSLILEASDTVITAIVPVFRKENRYFTTDSVSARVHKGIYRTGSLDHLKVHPPVVDSVSVKDVMPCETFYLWVRGFQPDLGAIRLGDKTCKLIGFDASSHKVTVTAPAVFSDLKDSIRVKMPAFSSAGDPVRVVAPVISYCSGEPVFTNDRVTLRGSGLSNPALHICLGEEEASVITFSDEEVTAKVPGISCDEVLPIMLKFGTDLFVTDKFLLTKRPENVAISASSVYPDSYTYNITGDFFPMYPGTGYPKITAVGQDGTEKPITNFSYNYKDLNQTSIFIKIPKNLGLGEWVNLRVEVCKGIVNYLDSAIKFPVPVISNYPGVVFNYGEYTVIGSNFESAYPRNSVYIGDHCVGTFQANTSTSLTFQCAADLPEGVYSLKVVTNEVESKPVEVVFHRRWKKIADLPYKMSSDVIAFYSNDIIYVGGGFNESHSFDLYACDLTSGTISKKAALPVLYGTSVNDDLFGYVVSSGAVYRYDLLTDNWTMLSALPITIPSYFSGLLYDKKIYFFPYQISDKQYYFDLTLNELVSYEGYSEYTSSCDLPYSVVPDGDIAYIIHLNHMISLDLKTLSYSYIWLNGSFVNWNRSANGIIHENMIYTYGESYLNNWNPVSHVSVILNGPELACHSYIFRNGDKAYIIGEQSIWELNLDFAK